jgi:hypothetical protein
MSEAPPAGKPTMIRICCEGQDWAQALHVAARDRLAVRKRRAKEDFFILAV